MTHEHDELFFRWEPIVHPVKVYWNTYYNHYRLNLTSAPDKPNKHSTTSVLCPPAWEFA